MMAEKKTIHVELCRHTVMRFDKDCIIELDIIGDSQVKVKLYNEIDGSEKTGSCKLKERSSNVSK